MILYKILIYKVCSVLCGMSHPQGDDGQQPKNDNDDTYKDMGWSVVAKDIDTMALLQDCIKDKQAEVELVRREASKMTSKGRRCQYKLDAFKEVASVLIAYILLRCPRHNPVYFIRMDNARILQVAKHYQAVYNKILGASDAEVGETVPINDWFNFFKKKDKRSKNDNLINFDISDNDGDSDDSESDTSGMEDMNTKSRGKGANNNNNSMDDGVYDQRSYQRMGDFGGDGEAPWYGNGKRGVNGEPPFKKAKTNGKQGGAHKKDNKKDKKKRKKDKDKQKRKDKHKGKNKHGGKKKYEESDTDSVSSYYVYYFIYMFIITIYIVIFILLFSIFIFILFIYIYIFV